MIKVEPTGEKIEGKYKVTTYKEATDEKGGKVNVESEIEVVTKDILASRKKFTQEYIVEEQKLITKLQSDVELVDQITAEVNKKE